MCKPSMHTPTWYCSKCADNSEKETNLGWGQEVKHIGERASTEATGEEKGEEIKEDDERKMATFGVAEDG